MPKPKGTYRILALGDSFTFGWGVNLEDSWPKILEKLLSKEQKVEVVNAGIIGGAPDTAVEVCRRYQYLDPDLIIFGFFSTDDLYQAADHAMSNADFDLKSYLFPNSTKGNKQFMMPVNYLVRSDGTVRHSDNWRSSSEILARAFNKFFSSLSLEVQKQLLSGMLNPGLVIESRVDSDYWLRMLDKQTLDFALKSVEKEFKKAKSVCSKDKPLMVLFFPSEELVAKEFFPYRQALGYKVDDRLLNLSYDQELGQLSNKYGFYYGSVLDQFRKEKCIDCYFPYDSHLSVLGNQKIAEYLANKISAIMNK